MKFSGLNKSQLESVIFDGGPLMIVAGAGSGKTKTLTNRVAHLVRNRGHSAQSLFVTTFTSKAADEMKERLVPLIGEQKSERLRIGTFHSLCRTILMKVLEKNSDDVFITPSLVFGGARFFKLRPVFSIAGLDPKKTIIALEKISWFKNHGLTVDDVRKSPEKFFADYYDAYEIFMRENDHIDFDDMLFRCWVELSKPENAMILESIRRKIDHFLVDESQDLNRIQFLLIRLLAGDNKNITVVGDDWQNIYSFRGAGLNHLQEFRDWLQPEIIKLEQNYRSTKYIVDLGNKLIKFNKNQIEKVLFTENDLGEQPSLTVSFDPDDEAASVFDKIESLITEQGFDLSEIAIIYRTNAQSRAIVDVLIKNQIPHKVHANYGFYDRREIKDILTYVRICSNPFSADLDDFSRIINRPTRFLGKKFIDAVEEHQLEEGIDTFWEGMVSYVSTSSDITPRNRTLATSFIDLLSGIFEDFSKSNIGTGDLIKLIMERTRYKEWMEKEDREEDEPDNDRKFNLDALMDGASRFPSVDDYIAFIDSMHKKYDDEDDVLHLMTIHKSKGLEFSAVFVIGMCDKLLPHYKCNDVDEERRCAYVAITRAKEQLFLSAIHGKYNRLNVTVSPFLREMGIPIPSLGHNVYGGGLESRSIGKTLGAHLDSTVGVTNGLNVLEEESYDENSDY